jgi:hypothetical protein
MIISKEAILESVQSLPDEFTLTELLDKLSTPKKQTAHQSEIKKIPQFGSMKGLVIYMAPDFNEPLGEFKEYMEV